MVAVLRGGATALRIGRNVREMERLVAAAFGKARGVMVNSGSSALYLAVELLHLEPGDEIVTAAVTFSTDIAPIVRSGSRAGLRRRHRGHVPDRRRAARGCDRPAHEGHPRAQPHRQLSRLGPNPCDRGCARPHGGRGLVRLPRRDVARHADRHARGHLGDELRAVAHHHRGRHRRHALHRRPRIARPRAAAPALGSPQRGEVLRLATRRQAFLLRARRARVRRPLHLRRGRLELRAVGALGRVRGGADAEAAAQPRSAEAQLRAPARTLRRAARTCSCCRAPLPTSTPDGTCSRS